MSRPVVPSDSDAPVNTSPPSSPGRHNRQTLELWGVDVPDPIELMLKDLDAQYRSQPAGEAFTRLYTDDRRFGHVFARLHERLNEHFDAINGRVKAKSLHYWASDSRDLLNLIDEIADTTRTLDQTGFPVTFAPDYRAELDRCQPWLRPSGGSPLPEDFTLIAIEKHRPVFGRSDTVVKLAKTTEPVPRHLVGGGSYAHVHSFTDPDYGIKFAVKQAKKTLDERELHRFKEEFRHLKALSFPNIVQVYRYDEDRNEYTMEFCDETLRDFIKTRNAGKLTSAARKRVAVQFLYGVNYLHYKNLLHRDLSLQNVMLKVFADGAVTVKLTDLGLVKDVASTYTRTASEMRGSIRDPSLDDFKNFGVVNEIYAVGHILAYIFTGREALPSDTDTVGRIVAKCTDRDPSKRYQLVADVIVDVEALHRRPTTGDAPA